MICSTGCARATTIRPSTRGTREKSRTTRYSISLGRSGATPSRTSNRRWRCRARPIPCWRLPGTEQRKQALATFLLKYDDQYADLFERVESCSEIVSNLTYGPNKRRFFCNYGGLVGAMVTASAVAFGKHWGGSNSSTQAQVQAIGTVMLALPGGVSERGCLACQRQGLT